MISQSSGRDYPTPETRTKGDPADAPAHAAPSVILACGLNESISDLNSDSLVVLEVSAATTVFEHFSNGPVDVLALGPALSTVDAVDILSRCVIELPASSTVAVVTCAGDASMFQTLIDADRIFYLARPHLQHEELRSILRAAALHARQLREGSDISSLVESRPVEELLGFCSTLASQTDVEDVLGVLAEAVENWIASANCWCMIYDDRQQSFLVPAGDRDERFAQTAASGISGYVARTGEWVQVDRVGDDPRFDPDTDARSGAGGPEHHQLVAAPIRDLEGRISAVIVVTRDATAPKFSTEDERTLSLLIRCAAPALASIRLQGQFRRVLLDEARTGRLLNVVRQEAVDHFTGEPAGVGEMLITLPRWLRLSHWTVVAFVVIAGLIASFVKIGEAVTGSAVIRARGKVLVTAPSSGLVRSVEVAVGDHVTTGDILIAVEGTPGTAPLESFHAQVRSPSNGTVGELLVRRGQRLAAGDRVASVIDEVRGYQVIALLPGSSAAIIRQGMPATFTLSGYADSAERLPIETVAREVLTPQDAARVLDRQDAGPLGLGDSIHVTLALRGDTFTDHGRRYHYRDGMTGRVDIVLRTSPFISGLAPALKNFFNR